MFDKETLELARQCVTNCQDYDARYLLGKAILAAADKVEWPEEPNQAMLIACNEEFMRGLQAGSQEFVVLSCYKAMRAAHVKESAR